MPDENTNPVKVPLHRRDGSVRAYALVDAADAGRALAHRWHLTDNGYAERCFRDDGGRVVAQLLQRFLFDLATGDHRQVDHINRDTLDYRRSNLRIVTHAQNQQNRGPGRGSSRHRGVTWITGAQKWRAQVRLRGQQYHLGYFVREEDAARVAAAFRAEHLPFSEN